MGAVGAGFTLSWRVIYLSTLLVFSVALSSCDPGTPASVPTSIPGPIKVKISNPGIKTAIVNLVGTDYKDTLDQDGLTLPYCADNQYISVWVPKYIIGIIDCNGSPVFEYPIELESLDVADNLNYNWVAADSRAGNPNNCANCHSNQQGRTEYPEWSRDGHSKVFVSPYFGTMYLGTDIHGNSSQQTVWGILGNGQRTRLAQDATYGPGYQLDYPGTFGNCAYCHAPAAVNSSKQEVDLSDWSYFAGGHINVETEGITCDVCHKVTDILLGKDKLPFADRPGVLSMSFVRPHSGRSLVVGPRPYAQTQDTAHQLVCSPVFSESEFCAACHYGKFSDAVIYASYKEWLDSPYSLKYLDSGDGQKTKENTDYRSCQDCHMLDPAQIGDTLPSQRSACSETNLNFRDFNHNMMNYGLDEEANPPQEIPLLIKNAAKLTVVEPGLEGEKIIVKVTVENTRAGHKFPTDSPLRHLILVVEARDENGTPLPQVDGPRIPLWGGVGNQADDYADRPGEIYANILKDKDTNIAPTVAYWNPTEPLSQNSDTRLLPKQPTYSEYAFAAPSYGLAVIRVRLMYRYAFIELARQKGWNRPDVLVTASEIWECNRLTDPVVFDCEPKVE